MNSSSSVSNSSKFSSSSEGSETPFEADEVRLYDSIAEEIASEEMTGYKKQLRTYMDLSYEKKPKHMKNWILSK